MDILKTRQAWIRSIIKERCGGVIAAFAKAIGKDPSYVSRMLYPPEKKGAKGIGEDTVREILTAFAGLKPPVYGDEATDSAVNVGGVFTRERRASDDVLALQIALESLSLAVLQKAPGAAEAFLADVKTMSRALGFSTTAGFLGGVVEIAEKVQRVEAEGAQVLRRAGSVGRTKRGK
jgi:hypothetical protein